MMRSRFLIISIVFWMSVFVVSPLFSGVSLAGQPEFENCMLEKLQHATDGTTVGQIRKACLPCLQPVERETEKNGTGEMSAVDRRLEEEKKTEKRPFVLTLHKPNYLLPVAYNNKPNNEPLTLEDGKIDHTEVKFQISFKYKLLEDLYRNNWDLHVAYTNLSFWQAYNENISSPFRETSHEPEIWLSYRNDWPVLGGMKNSLIRLGFSHHSNGRGGTTSRSWNRLYADLHFSGKNFTLNIKPWYRIPESDKDYLGDPTGDDNPDIDRYMGYGEIAGAYTWHGHEFTMMIRNNLRSPHNRATVEVGWSFPLYGRLKGYVQYFYGYGESLIDYDALTSRIGIGVLLSSWQ